MTTSNYNRWENGYKVCSDCGEKKHESDYYTAGKTGRFAAYCKACGAARSRDWQAKNAAKVKATKMAWRAENDGLTYEDSNGYVRVFGFSHPVACKNGITPQHRMILWDEIGPDPIECHWGCGRTLLWDADFKTQWDEVLVVDHLNGVTNDNRPENLVPSCNACNISRGIKAKKAAKAGVA